jgi:hypothetical protein
MLEIVAVDRPLGFFAGEDLDPEHPLPGHGLAQLGAGRRALGQALG